MSIGLDCWTEVRKDGQWNIAETDSEMDFSYDAIVFLTGRKNDDHCAPVLGEDKQYRGYPDDSAYLNEKVEVWWGDPITRKSELIDSGSGYYFNISWVTLAELLSYDYDTVFEDRYNMMGEYGNRKFPEGEGKITTMRDFLGEHFMQKVEYLKTLGEPDDVRVIFWLS
jgi:hypothetical protein